MNDICARVRTLLHHNDIGEFCGSAAYQRGSDYFQAGRVLSLKVVDESPGDDFRDYDSLRLIAYARGSGDHKYRQDIALTVVDDGIDIDGECSCPVGYNCKHVAAACLHFMNQASETSTSVEESSTVGQTDFDAWFDNLTDAVAVTQARAPSSDGDYLVYVLKPRVAHRTSANSIEIARLGVEIRATRLRKNGQGFVQGRTVSRDSLDYSYSSNQWEVQAIDREVSAFLKSLEQPMHAYGSQELRGRSGGLALINMVRTGRCYWLSLEDVRLFSAEPRELHCRWTEQDGLHTLQLGLEKPAQVLPTEPPMYLDELSGAVGALNCGGLTGAMLEVIAETPTVSREHAVRFSRQLRLMFPQLSALPTPVDITVRTNDSAQAMPRIQLQQLSGSDHHNYHSLALLFEYAGDTVAPVPAEAVSVISNDDEIIHIHRDTEAESAAILRLESLGFTSLSGAPQQSAPLVFAPRTESRIESAAIWADFLETDVKALRADGWQVEIDESFALEFIDADWQTTIDDVDISGSGNDWFELRFDLDIDGRQIPLAPLLIPILEEDPDTLPDTITLPVDDGNRYLRLRSERVRPFLKTLRELFERAPPNTDGVIRLSRFDALLLDQLGDNEQRIKGAQKLRTLAARLSDFNGIENVPVPTGFGAELRSYQQAGLNWLQFLREYEFNGVLADDMGLGKTVQTLAHLLVEKRSGRLQQPALVVAPTSLMGNWRREAEYFAPDLRVVVLYGKDRARLFVNIESSDLILTTYPLLTRDAEILLPRHYHIVVLDEAQAIKNPTTKMARTVREFNANHKLCLTGTPLENHLGELWSLYDFLMPGFLGNLQVFNRCYRVPIEKHGNAERREQLARRIQPFMLRREKDQVASELPPKLK